MIVLGYQGVGKSSLVKRDKRYIDLESSSFWINGERDPNWYIPYCEIAIKLEAQGHDILLSSHQVVRDYLQDHSGQKILVYPSLAMYNYWCNKLLVRYEQTLVLKKMKRLTSMPQHDSKKVF